MAHGLLQDCVAWVTGAGRGFGAGVARGLARAGARVCITDIDAHELMLTADEMRSDGSEVMTLLVDVSDAQAMESAATAVVANWGRLDTVINNAAVMPLASFAEHTPTFWRMMVDVNLTGVYHGVWAAWPHMVRQGGGHCIAIASGASMRGFVNEVAYCATKHGIEGFAKALALEAAPYNIAVNTMGPGKLIKPTSVRRIDEAALSDADRAGWTDPLLLAPALVWLVSQPPCRFTGLRFDAGPLANTIATEGYDFDFTPEKATLYVEEMEKRRSA